MGSENVTPPCVIVRLDRAIEAMTLKVQQKLQKISDRHFAVVADKTG
jgi:hypothetical protein